jgi:chemotaxis protein MotB
MLRRQILQDSHNHERWLISYADFMTLLFGFFVVMYAISSVNEGKYKVLSSALNEVFAQRELTLTPIQVGQPAQSSAPSAIPLTNATASDHVGADAQLESIAEALSGQLAGVLGSDQFSVAGHDQWLELNLDAAVLFDSGHADLAPLAHDVLAEVVKLLSGLDNPVTVEGYTDNVAISTSRFASNWELSSARSAAVVRAFESLGLDPDRLAAVGYGEQHPLATNATPQGRKQNRRVTIVVARDADVQRGLTAIGAQRGKAVDLQWRDETAGEDVALDPSAVQAVRRAGGGVLFTNQAPQLPPER